ncbi:MULTISPECIES: amidohydrolase [unclassified Sphingobium]|uniref:amidohydrolase n=1 Tax=unclassified Sphingobium TaxID=2611147 RepID=UPI0022252A2A|nr:MULTISPECIES: amidohydrolase [unclassified Sphingobium]MCW2395467.1 hippurate hydrolase [Sphingobium sp. B8D3B]MCW2418982.1 hippurate hydrolase [Sphingobium sp. B8D3C]
MLKSPLALLLAMSALASPAMGATVDARATAAIEQSIKQSTPDLIALYRDLHANPELSLAETRTAARLAQEMRKLGLEVTEKVGGTGVVAVLRNGEGPVVLIRADMDALPMKELSQSPFASTREAQYQGKTTFVAHSCGHDLHMAWWVGTAKAMLAMRDQWRGTMLFVAQPGEESGQGARKMVEDGLFTRFPKPDYGFAAHVGNDPVGRIVVKQGAFTSNSDTIRITFKGKGGHGSMPSRTIDPIVMGARFVMDVQTVVSRQKDPFEFGVVTVGSFQAGSAANIIPDTASLALTLRSFSPEVREQLVEGVKRTALSVAAMSQAPEPVIDHSRGAASVINDDDLAAKTAAALRTAGWDDIALIPASAPGGSASEDYSELVSASGMRSVYLGVGGYLPSVIADYAKHGEPLPTNHSPYFLPDAESAIPTAIRSLSVAALSVLANPK